MTIGIHEQASKEATKKVGGEFSERALWSAVILQALEDWQSGNMRRRKEAEKFFFSSEKDFATVCRGAGLEPGSVLPKLQKMKTVARPSFNVSVWAGNANLQVQAAA
jgi:hypothetical protein